MKKTTTRESEMPKRTQILKKEQTTLDAGSVRFFGQGNEPMDVEIRLYDRAKSKRYSDSYTVEVVFPTGKRGLCFHGFDIDHAEQVYDKTIA